MSLSVRYGKKFDNKERIANYCYVTGTHSIKETPVRSFVKWVLET